MALGDGQGEIGDLLKTVEGYNRDDCISALRLRDWLEDRRKELEAKNGSCPAQTSRSIWRGEREIERTACRR